MRLASFNLEDHSKAGYDADAEAALNAMPGVSDVLIGEVNDTCSVVYDEHGVTTAQLLAALSEAGYASRLVMMQPQARSCCGSCGG
ncbi:MAG: heavy-metal-associated domain-containing protein [Pseudomonadota bacterium]